MVRFDPSDVGRGDAGVAEEDGMKDVSRTRKRKRHATDTKKKTKTTTETTTKRSTKPATKMTKKPTKRPRVEAEPLIAHLPEEVWMIICEHVCHDMDEEKMTRTNRAGDVVDKSKDVYKKRLEALFAMRQTCSTLRNILSGDFGEQLFCSAFHNLAEFTDAADGAKDAPALMLWMQKAWYLVTLGCQGCDKHATTRKPNWTFGVRMCKECLMKRTVCDWELKRDKDEWTEHATYEELTASLPSDEVHGFNRHRRRNKEYTMTRFWKKSVKKRIALLKQAKTPAEREAICAPPAAPQPPAARPHPRPRAPRSRINKTSLRRKEELETELALLGCELRIDSKLSKLFITGFPRKPREREHWTAKRVARRMAEMKYIHEYCPEFQDTIDEMHEEIDDHRRAGFRNATEFVTGFRDFGDAVRYIADTWADFPPQWPWLEDDTAA